MEKTKLSTTPGNLLFSLKDITYSPETPRRNDPFTVKGTVELFTIPFLAPIWVIVTIEYPETWWEEIIPVIGAPRERKSGVVFGSTFEIEFPKGFIREGDFKLIVGVYAGPTMLVDNWTLPPFPPVATEEATFVVSGVAPPKEALLDERAFYVPVGVAPPPGEVLLDERAFYVPVGVAPPPGLKSPECKTLDAEDIIHDTAILWGSLIDTGFWSNVDVYFEWGKTTSYGKKTPKVRMYEGQEGSNFYAELLHYLEPNTTYHFRAVVEAVGYRSEEVGPGYGANKSFTTKAEVVKGFTMRVVNPRAGATQWRAGANSIYMPNLQPLDYVWKWTGSVPDEIMRLFVMAAGPWKDGMAPTIQYDEFPFRLRNGKNYVWDFATQQMWDNGTVWPPY